MNKKNVILVIILIFSFTSSWSQQRGKATFYSKRATGSMTSSGQRLHHDSLTCAHKYYPFGTLLKVKNINNGKEVIVKVTDRGPYGKNRIIDLSWAAAKELGMLAKGVAVVEIEKYDNTVIPLRDNNPAVPFIDFEVAEEDSYYSIPEWQNNIERPKKFPTKIRHKK